MRKKKVTFDKHEKGLIAFACVLLLFVLIGRLSWGAVVNQAYVIPSVGGQYDSARVDTYVLNGTSFAFVDSQSVLSLPKDTTFGLNDTANWVVYVTYYFGTDSVTDPLFYNLNPSATATATVDYDSIATLISNGYAGGGLYKVLFYTIDTSGTDDTISSTMIDINTSSGSDYAGGIRNYTGLDSFNLDAGTYQALVYKTGYQFDAFDFTIAGNDTVALNGYNTVTIISSPTSSSLCRVYGQVYDALNNAVPYPTLTFTCDDIVNTCDSVIIGKFVYKLDGNDTGYFQVDLLKNSCMEGTRVWMVDLEYYDYNNNLIKKPTKRISIPTDSSTYKLYY